MSTIPQYFIMFGDDKLVELAQLKRENERLLLLLKLIESAAHEGTEPPNPETAG